MFSQRIVDAFTGKKNEISVKIRGTDCKLYVFFGGIRIPDELVGNLKPEELENVGRKYDCIIKRKSKAYEVIPHVVREIIERDGVLASYSEEHAAELENWLRDCFISLLSELVRRS